MTSNQQDIYLASSRRPLELRMRVDLVAQRQNYLGRRYWVLKDPLTLEYYRFEEEEYFLLQSLAGHINLQQLKDRFEQRFTPQKIALSELHRFLGTVHRNGLVTSTSRGQGDALEARGREKRKAKRLQTLTNILGVRTRGIDPDRLLTALHGRVGFLFSLPAIIVVLVLGLSALLLVGTQYDTFARRLPQFGEFFAVQNWAWLAATLAVTKVLHEFGHGLACKRLGGECHEMGIMLLVFTPCLYCNVSDSWMLNNKWHRAAIAAAGMYIELFLAAVATWVWWYSVPGTVHYLALNVMFICSVSTLLFNANPLMRYDGYYILADVIEIPNLRQKASKVLGNWMSHRCLGIPAADDPFLPHKHQWFFATYSIAAVVYRWVITFSILWFLNQIFEPYGLQILGQAIAVVSLFGLVVVPARKLSRFLLEGVKMRRIRWSRLTATSLVLVGGCLLLFVPIPYHVRCGVQLELRDDEPVYVEVPGFLQEVYVKQGVTLNAGQPIARLENQEIHLELINLASQHKRLDEELQTLTIRALGDPLSASRIAEVRAKIGNLRDLIAHRKADAEKLTLTAANSGMLFPVAHRPASTNRKVLSQWSGQPLTMNNLGAYFEKGMQVGTIGDPSRLQAILTIDQSNVPFVVVGQQVELILDQHPTTLFTTTIQIIGRRNAGDQLTHAAQDGTAAATTDETSRNNQHATLYFASAPLEISEFVSPSGQGTASIAVGKRTMFERICRAVSRTFRFRL
ncbi:MAG TPA: HlyD family efflux transporter periplasmic adaptor subunit [Planctomycetaceae bacterium]|nr:HlyD family efflux transporter periplasmic adaptor subunit [Planctomycetaceae bacterium]